MRGTRRYNDEDRLDYTIDHYNVDVSFDPGTPVARGTHRSRPADHCAQPCRRLTLRLAEPLVLRAVTSDEFGRLLALRVRGQNNIVVNLPDSLRRGQTLRLRVSYGGRLPPVPPEREAITAGQQMLSEIALEPEPRFVYSHRSYWYPQSSVTAFATARIRVTVPPDFTVLGSGMPDPPTSATAPDGRPRRAFTFRALQPVRYLSIAVSRFVQVVSGRGLPPAAPTGHDAAAARGSRAAVQGVFYDEAAVELWSQPRQTTRARDLLETTTDIIRFYGDLVDDLPFPRLRLALAEDTLPGGHSPAYFALLHQPMPGTPFTWARDPVAFDDFPQFFLAHELAHQFWGQAVAGENYHEQWISEGFAQFFTLLYAQKTRRRTPSRASSARCTVRARGQRPGADLARLPARAPEERQPGLPRHRLQQERAGAAHAAAADGRGGFSRGLQRFYGQSRFRRVGTDDLRAAMETEYGRPLERFFERWIYGADIPRPADELGAGGTGDRRRRRPGPGREHLRLILEQGPQVHDVP